MCVCRVCVCKGDEYIEREVHFLREYIQNLLFLVEDAAHSVFTPPQVHTHEQVHIQARTHTERLVTPAFITNNTGAILRCSRDGADT